MNIIKLIEENFFATGHYWGSLNSSINRWHSIRSMCSAIPSADLNWVWNEKPITLGDTRKIKQIKKYYEQLALPFWWWAYPRGQSSSLTIFVSSGFLGSVLGSISVALAM